MILDAPTFVDSIGDFPDWNIDSMFAKLTGGFGIVRKKLGEERYASLMDLSARAKALFEIENVLKDVSNRRVQAKLPDDEGEVTGD